MLKKILIIIKNTYTYFICQCKDINNNDKITTVYNTENKIKRNINKYQVNTKQKCIDAYSMYFDYNTSNRINPDNNTAIYDKIDIISHLNGLLSTFYKNSILITFVKKNNKIITNTLTDESYNITKINDLTELCELLNKYYTYKIIGITNKDIEVTKDTEISNNDLINAHNTGKIDLINYILPDEKEINELKVKMQENLSGVLQLQFMEKSNG